MKTYNYIDILSEHYKSRQLRNISYSLRSFARDIGISPSSLSLILKKRQGVSFEKGKIISERLGLTIEEKDFFLLDIQRKNSRSVKTRALAKEKMDILLTKKDWSVINSSSHSILKSWENIAIYDFIKSKKNITKKEIINHFSFTDKTTELAIITLDKLNFIKRDGDFLYTKASKDRVESVTSSKIIQNFHHQVLEQMKKSIDNQSLDEREVTSTFLTIEDKSLGEIKKEIEKFRLHLCDKYSVDKKKKKIKTIGITLGFFNAGGIK
jgi:uncharacterized protein (TIGR02147 family)